MHILFFLFFSLQPGAANSQPTAATAKTLSQLKLPLVADLETTTLNPTLQFQLGKYIRQKSNPVASVVVVDVETGSILAMAEGKKPEAWDNSPDRALHTALHTGFPAASLFKNVVTAAALEIAQIQPEDSLALQGGCSKIRLRAIWLKESVTYPHRMTLRKAFGKSCNGFFAKMAVNKIGLGAILHFSEKFGWNQKPIPADFHIPASPYMYPNPIFSSTHTIGKFAAGFGYIGMSTLHAAWQVLTIANDGISKPLRLYKNSRTLNSRERILSQKNARALREMMDATVFGGTATYAFRHGKARRLRKKIGGKTGTLSGKNPRGIATWFSGMMPLDRPEIVVAAIVVIDDLWKIKGPHLAAKAFVQYDQIKKKPVSADLFQSAQSSSLQRIVQ